MPAPGQEETVRIVALDRDFHVHCYRCEVCGQRPHPVRPWQAWKGPTELGFRKYSSYLIWESPLVPVLAGPGFQILGLHLMLVTLDKSLYCSVSISPPVKRTQILMNRPKFG